MTIRVRQQPHASGSERYVNIIARMLGGDNSAARQRLNQAFEEFESTLREMLTEEARRSIDGTLQRLSTEDGPFRLQDVEVEVTIRSLTFAGAEGVGASRSPAKQRPTPRRRPRTGRAAKAGAVRGRPTGRVRSGLLTAFDANAELSTGALRAHLAEQGVTTSADNVHQHLRRLVRAGQLERSGRGVYRRATTAG